MSDTKVRTTHIWSKTPLLLIGVVLFVWFFMTRLQFEKYQTAKAISNPIEKVGLLQSIYKPNVYTHHRNHSIASDISYGYYAMDSIEKALMWVKISLADDKSSRESILLSAKLHLRHTNDMEKAEDLLESYSDIYSKNFDVNLLLLELALRKEKYQSVRSNRDAVVHSQYSLRKSILELCLHNSEYLYEIVDITLEQRELLEAVFLQFAETRDDLILNLPLIERAELDSMQSKDLSVIVKTHYVDFEQELVQVLDPEQLLGYVHDRWKNYHEFRITYDLGQHGVEPDEADLLYEALLAFKNRKIMEGLVKDKTDLIDVPTACNMLSEDDLHMDRKSRSVLRILVTDCMLPNLKLKN